MNNTLTDEQIESIAEMIEDCRKIEAIKMLKTYTRCGLREAREIIDEFPCPHNGYDFERRTANRTKEQVEEAMASAKRFRKTMPGREIVSYIEMGEKIDALIEKYGIKRILKHVVGRMEDR